MHSILELTNNSIPIINKTKKENTCCFMGNIDTDKLKSDSSILKDKLTVILSELIEKGVSIFYSNGKYGISMIGAEIIIEMKKKQNDLMLYLVVPYTDYELKYDKKIRERYRRICNDADNAEILDNIYKGNDFMGTLYSEKLIMDKSNVVLIDKDKYGAVNYANKNGLRVINIFE
ncbi:MAG: SLOG family protein [Clostridia bacterium]|nr:SLOG family protein [Clostridia bacterium]